MNPPLGGVNDFAPKNDFRGGEVKDYTWRLYLYIYIYRPISIYREREREKERHKHEAYVKPKQSLSGSTHEVIERNAACAEA